MAERVAADGSGERDGDPGGESDGEVEGERVACFGGERNLVPLDAEGVGRGAEGSPASEGCG